ncbi:AcrR family transcriptional regulator [Microbacterium sp. W4I4]|uniref:TetR/AcrR family transcriptional regulator n=1 Tax=Microbacterium sp. W4I4 TaxID=3042295 RepID=UPI00277F9811|nr:TetR/AcrR family transcriptional regulator [Microbacterium sp. W4I4]MDQ0613992.1 AcrR family transcriptional regulator [Microbacterium sp. W4I4]
MARPTGPRGPYAKSKARRDAVAGVVLDLVEEFGHRAVTSAEVAERAGMSEATVLYHFPSKEHLLAAALKAHDDRERERTAGLAHYELAGTLAKAGVERQNTVRLYVAMAAEASDPEHPAHTFFVRRYAAIIDSYANEVKLRQARGLADPALDPTEVGRQIIAMWDGLQAQWLIAPTFDIANALDRAMRVLTRRDDVVVGAP